MAAHLTVEELADAAAGLLDTARAAEVADHLAGCARCAAARADLDQVSARLAAEPTPAMPPAVAARLSAVIDAEQQRRETGRAAAEERHRQELAHRVKPTLGPVGSGIDKPHRARFLVRALAACVAAAAVGFAGYAAGARAGLGEPQALRSPISSRSLAPQAEQLRSGTDLSSHWLSRAWTCAGKVVDGRITDIARVTVDGAPALLVYTDIGDRTRVTVVTGCPDEPRAGASTDLPR
ncbi:MAG TPA: hypothetical protein VK020_08665 [Microlunatus sp.]|nr:hypothetical protein [Microlunatus sp.]